MTTDFDALVEAYPAWWIDALGEHNHIGGLETTAWLAEHAGISSSDTVLDAGAFVGAAARYIATETGARTVAIDIGRDFLDAGQHMEGGAKVGWAVATSSRLPFADRTFSSVWCLDSYMAPREFSRVAKEKATICLCCEVPVDGRGGVEAFVDEWAEYGWEMAAHKQMSMEATQTWRNAEMELVRQRPRFHERYGPRGYLAQLDIVADLVRTYEFGQLGHGLFVFRRG